jgi:biotin operon repressor
MSSYQTCRECEAVLKPDEIAIYMKLVTRNATDFLCIDCLGKKLNCGRGPIEERIKYFRESGNCTLFR